jgi:hypothetical protein
MPVPRPQHAARVRHELDEPRLGQPRREHGDDDEDPGEDAAVEPDVSAYDEIIERQADRLGGRDE